VASLADAAPGRVAFGIGTSSEAIVERWNGVPFEEPYRQVRDMVRFLREAMAGGKVSGTYGRSEVRGFKLGIRPAEQPAILIAALRQGMLRLAGREGDGVIINWLSAQDVRTVAPIAEQAAADAGRPAPEVVARIFVAQTTDRETVLGLGRFVIPMYLAAAPVYAEFHRWLGRGEELSEMWRLWDEGDRAGAQAAIPESVVDDLIVSGPPEACREHIARYVEAGVTTPALAILPAPGVDQRQAVRDLAPQG
jgi:probable F420-dependent oxidoreductase